MTQPAVLGFFGPFRFLSNFHYVDIVYEQLCYPTTEHAYQAAKSKDRSIRAFFASTAIKPSEARRLGQEIPLDPEWHTRIKFEVMYDLTKLKFEKDPLRRMLLDTGDMYLEETNTWGDTCWGVCNQIGDNRLGKILMQVRGEIRNTESSTHGA